MNTITSLRSLLMDHLRLALMSKIQREDNVSYLPLIFALILVSAVSFVYDTYDTESDISLSNIYDKICHMFLHKKTITLEGKHATSVEQYNSRNMITVSNTFSLRFRAVMYHITTSMNEMRDLYELKEIVNVINRADLENKTMLSVSQKTRILLDAKRGIYCNVQETLDKGNEPKEAGGSSHLRVYRFNITLFSYKSSLAVINEYIDELADIYNAHLETLRKDKLFVYTLNNVNSCDEDNDEMVNGWQETPHETMKSFHNLFFEQKQNVLKKVDFFVNNKEWYKTNGVPYTLGIALYGEPGTGKTSFIKALATKLGRHIISISLASIKTRKQLHDVYHTTKYGCNDKNQIGFDKKIIVFEDIDCIGDIILRRDSADTNASPSASTPESRSAENTDAERIIGEMKTLAKQITDTNKSKPSPVGPGVFKDDTSDKITLDDLLNLWDGIRENTGRIMIITTNHYHKLDPALVRPGRIDISLHLGNATRKTIGEMYAHYYGSAIPEDILEKIPDKKHSPAQIINYYVSNHDNPEGFLNLLCE